MVKPTIIRDNKAEKTGAENSISTMTSPNSSVWPIGPHTESPTVGVSICGKSIGFSYLFS
jgi:hypothetical protein